MTYGLKIRNDAGDIQIDATYRNLQIVAEGTDTFSSAGLVDVFVDISFGAIADPPIICVRSPSGPLGLVRMLLDGSGNYVGARLIGLAFGSYGFDWFIAAPGTASAETWGMRVYTDAGQVAFDSGRRYLRVTDVVRLTSTIVNDPGSYDGEGYITLTHAANAGAYYMLGRGWLAEGEGGPVIYLPSYRATDSTHVSIAQLERGSIAVPSSYPSFDDVYVVVCDKTP